MITKKLILDFERHEGDIDSWSRSRRAKIEMYEDWYLIASILQDILIVNQGLASKEFEEKVKETINSNCDTQETIDELFKLAHKRN